MLRILVSVVSVLLAAVLLLQNPAVVLAQETRGSIKGLVLDPSEAIIPDVTVQATNLATDVSLSTKSNADGAYSILYLNPGTYRLTAEAAGFKTFVREGIVVRIPEAFRSI